MRTSAWMAATAMVMGATTGLFGCATSFTGSPHVEGGRGGCEKKCNAQGMEVAGLVYMGEYSSACVCAPPGQAAGRDRLIVGSAGGVAGAAVGVIMQQRRQEDSQRTN